MHRVSTFRPPLLAALIAGLALVSQRLHAEEPASATAELVKALRDDNSLVRKRAALALGRLGVTAKDALPALKEAARDKDENVRAAAVAACAQVQERDTRDALLRRLADKQAPAAARATAGRELAERFGQDLSVVRELEALLSDTAVKDVVAKALDAIDGPKPSATGPRQGPTVAVLNVAAVMKQYRKCNQFEQEFRDLTKEYEQKHAFLKKRLETCKQATGLDQAVRDANEREMLRLQREVQDVTDEAKRLLGRKQSDFVVEVYRDVQRAAERYAQAHAIDLVLQYSDAPTEAEKYNPANVQRKLAGGSCLPLYGKSGDVDISDKVLAILNAEHGAAASGK